MNRDRLRPPERVGCVGAGLTEQASRREATQSYASTVSFDRDAAHLELAVLDPEGEAAFDEVERILAELFVAPA